MKKSGFTLAEVLITLGIIGVIAALVLPALVRQSSNREIMGRLSSNVTNLESAFTRAIEEEHVDEIRETEMWQHRGNNTEFIGEMKKYFPKISNFRLENAGVYYRNKDLTLNFMNNDGTENRNSSYAGEASQWTIELADGAVLFITFYNPSPLNEAQLEAQAFDRGTVIKDIAAEIIIDANGANRPNVIGRDAFKFYLATDGKLYPHGSKEYSRYLDGNDNQAWTGNVAGSSCQTGNLRNTWGCSARVVDEGYVINY